MASHFKHELVRPSAADPRQAEEFVTEEPLSLVNFPDIRNFDDIVETFPPSRPLSSSGKRYTSWTMPGGRRQRGCSRPLCHAIRMRRFPRMLDAAAQPLPSRATQFSPARAIGT
jgi:hypothetical protein